MLKARGRARERALRGAQQPPVPAHPAHAAERLPKPDMARGGTTQAEARQFMPPGCKLSKEKVWSCRWRVEADCLVGQSFIFRPELEGDDNRALLAALRYAWAGFCRHSGAQNPWDLSGP